MGQTLARRDVDRGLRFYKEQRFEEAIECWSRAMKGTKKLLQKFDILGFLCMSYYDIGKYRDMSSCAVQQLEIANQADVPGMHSEAYLNLARSYEKLSEFKKAISFCNDCSQYETKSESFQGHVALCLGKCHFGQSDLMRTLQNYDKALAKARAAEDKVLELLVYSELGDYYTALKDRESSLSYHTRASEIARGLELATPNSKYHRLTAVNVAVPCWQLGRYNEAMEHCEDAMKMAITCADRPVQARCLLNFADINRKRNDLERAYPRYQSAFSIMSEIGDRLGQVDALAGMAKTMAALNQWDQAIELNKRSLITAEDIGNTLRRLRCHYRLEGIYEALDDIPNADQHMLICRRLTDRLELYCGVCSETIAHQPDKLEPLPCGHLIHERCLVHLSRSTWGRAGRKRPCPSCRRRSAANPAMYT